MYENRLPTTRGLCHLCILQSNQPRYRRAGQVNVEDANVVAELGEGEGELESHGRFTDTTFTRQDDEDVPNIVYCHGGVLKWAGEGEDLDVGVRNGGHPFDIIVKCPHTSLRGKVDF